MIEGTMEIDELPENDERLLRKPEIKRGKGTKPRLKVLRLIEKAVEIDVLPENDERLLRKPEIKRDEISL
jgi:hypothetical protein